MPSLIAWASCCAVVAPMWMLLSPWSKQSHGCSCQGCKATNHTGTFRNLPNPTSWTHASIHRNPPKSSGTFRNLPPEPTPFYTGTLGNLPEPASGTYTSTLRNSPGPEPSGTRLRNLHHPELSGTFRNLSPEPAPATRTGTHRSLSGLKTPLAYAVGEKSCSEYVLAPFQKPFELALSASLSFATLRYQLHSAGLLRRWNLLQIFQSMLKHGETWWNYVKLCETVAWLAGSSSDCYICYIAVLPCWLCSWVWRPAKWPFKSSSPGSCASLWQFVAWAGANCLWSDKGSKQDGELKGSLLIFVVSFNLETT